MITITRRLEFDYGHRLQNHEGKCRHAHGHRGVAEITVTAANLDGVGRIVDFGEIKRRVGGWLDATWDHAFLAEEGDPIITGLRATDNRICVMPGPPSAENMAQWLFHRATALLEAAEISVVSVRLYETPQCWADYAP